MQADRKEMAAGAFLLAVALFFFLYAIRTLPMGSSFQMGPGYLPIVLSVLLALLGMLTLVHSLGRASSAFGAVSWRGVVLTTAASVSFATTIPRFGLVPAVLVAVLLSAYSSRRMTIRLALSLALGLALFCALIFRYALELPVQLFGAA
jgi:hypothetical protein